MWVRSLAQALAVVVSLGPVSSLAQTLLPPAAATSSGVYVWVDGSYRSVNLPTYSLGVHTADPVTFGDLGPTQAFKSRVTGEAVNGGISFTLPEGNFPTAFGSNLRIGVAGGYIRADAKQSAYAISPAPVQMWLDGSLFFGCGCEFWSNLATEYSGWRFGLNLASDVKVGGVTFTPSIEIVSGVTRVRQTLSQLDSFEVYDSYTRLKWSDLGIKFGASATVPIAPMLEFGVTGSLAVVHRRASLVGNDLLADLVAGPLLATSIDTSAHTWAVVPSGQVQFIISPAPQMQIRIFGGVEWDSRVPGIVSPHFTPDQFFTFMGSPASIGFSGQTSYFAGGGFTYAFNR